MTSTLNSALRRSAVSLYVFVLGATCVSAAVAQVSISDGGTPSYAYPIPVPPGIAGMTPSLALTYSGAGINGPLGYGWSIQGMSVITRCPQIKAIDGAPKGVAFGVNDKLCLDGQRLIQTDANGSTTNVAQTADSQGGTGMVREFRTEKDSYARIRAYGTSGSAAANGPAYFKVWTKSGQIYEYGPNSNSSPASAINVQGQSVISAWPVSRIADTVGNYIDFYYTQRDVGWGSGVQSGASAGHEWNLLEIRYTGNTTTSQPPTNSVAFAYFDRAASGPTGLSDRSEAYQRGAKNVSIQRLTTIKTFTNIQTAAVEVKLINLTYTTSTVTGRSLLTGITECSGAHETVCLSGPTFQYTAGGDQSFAKSASFAASASNSLPMLDATAAKYGVVVGDFNGDGKADILRWGDTTTNNQILLSKGDGTFNMVTPGSGAGQFNLTSQKLFSADGCYTSTVADFNGDGLADILRTTPTTSASGGACSGASNLLFLSNGDGSFQPGVALTGIDLSVIPQVYSTINPQSCTYVLNELHDGDRLAMADTSITSVPVTPSSQTCYDHQKTLGAAFFILDVNGDGILDTVTTVYPYYLNRYQSNQPNPTADQLCASTVCTHVYTGSAQGSFTEQSTNLAHHSVYNDPITPGTYGAFIRPGTVDVDGDGLTDLAVQTGVWVSSGDNNFAQFSQNFNVSCGFPLDFNGDGRFDCFTPSIDGTASGQTLQVLTGSASSSPLPTVAGFNLKTNGTNELYAPNTGAQTIGTLFGDFNGDGRTDILRWENDPTKNTIYLSNGDGTFSTSTTFNLTSTAQGLQNSDGKTAYVAADFRGLGVLEILRLKDSPTAASEGTGNQLYVRTNPTPPDLLASVLSANLLRTTLTWVPLTSATPPAPDDVYGSRYTSDRFDPVNKAKAGQVDLSIPLYVVAKTVSDSGVSTQTVTTQYSYAGLKAANDGRGLLGFRETKRQSPAPDSLASPLTVDTNFLQIYPYTGVARSTSSYQGSLTTAAPSSPLSQTTYAYCDQSATSTTPIPNAPCPVSAKVQHPFLSQSVASGRDISGAAFPTVTTTNTFDAFGNSTSIIVQTVGAVLGTQQTVAKTTSNFFMNDTSGDNWVLGRLTSASQHNTVPNFLSSIAVGAGSAPNASATQGTGTLPPAPPAFLPMLSVPPFSSSTVGTPTTRVATLTNSGGAPGAVTVPAASSVTGTDFSFVSTTCSTTLPANASCGITVQFLPTAAVTRTGNISVTTQGGTLSAALSGAIGTSPPALSLGSCVSTTPTITPTAATYSCALSNGGQTDATSVSYSVSIGNATVASSPSACPVGNCGTVVVTTSTAAGNYSGTVTATPNAGSATSSTFNLVVNAAASFGLSTPSFSSTMVGVPTTAVATLTNSGGSAATVTVSSSSVTGPDFALDSTTCGASLAAGSSCTVKVSFTPTAAGTRTGSLAVGTQVGTQTVSLSGVGLSAPALSLTSCTSTTPTTAPTAATYSCTLSNNGQVNATSVGYAVSIGGATVTNPPSSCAVGACGTVVVTTSTSAGNYNGTVTATPNVGSAVSSTFNLVVNAPVPLTFTLVSSTGASPYTTTFKNPNTYSVTPTASGVTATGGHSVSISSNTCSSAVAGGGTCAMTFTAPAPDCKLDNYTATPYVANSGGTAYGPNIPISTTKSPCP